MEHVPVRVSERQDHIGLSDDTDQSEQINYSNGCIRVHAQLDQGHGVSKGALMFCFLFSFFLFLFLFLLAHFRLVFVKGGSSLLTLCWVWFWLLTECI